MSSHLGELDHSDERYESLKISYCRTLALNEHQALVVNFELPSTLRLGKIFCLNYECNCRSLELQSRRFPAHNIDNDQLASLLFLLSHLVLPFTCSQCYSLDCIPMFGEPAVPSAGQRKTVMTGCHGFVSSYSLYAALGGFQARCLSLREMELCRIWALGLRRSMMLATLLKPEQKRVTQVVDKINLIRTNFRNLYCIMLPCDSFRHYSYSNF